MELIDSNKTFFQKSKKITFSAYCVIDEIFGNCQITILASCFIVRLIRRFTSYNTGCGLVVSSNKYRIIFFGETHLIFLLFGN